jgi:predicted nucleic acid-binding protein
MMVVADAGPLLALAKAGALFLLSDLYQQVITGPAVYTEAVTAGLALNVGDAVVLDEAYQQGQLLVRTPSPEVVLPQPALLHAGEAESIQLAIELQADWLLIDELAARQMAQQNFAATGTSTGIKGTLGVIVTATQAEIISPGAATDLVKTLKDRPDVWLAPALC